MKLFTENAAQKAAAVVALMATLPTADAFFRIVCSGPLVRDRADPIMNPGAVSGHVHTVSGGNGFNFTMEYEDAAAPTCTSCNVKEDLSNYWTPELWVKAKNGSYHHVKNGGHIVYYLHRRANPQEELIPFPKGFRMIAGNPDLRSYNKDSLEQRAVQFSCIGGPTGERTPNIPPYNCPGGLRADLNFPSCWDGKNLDSPDHKSHVAYPDGVDNGKCPPTHPKRFISIFYELYIDIDPWKSEWDGNKHPFVFSQGDPTGYGYHGDFINGWDIDKLNSAIQKCDGGMGSVEECAPVSGFTLNTGSAKDDCKISPRVTEEIDDWRDSLPGCNPIQSGPANATPQKCDDKATIGGARKHSTDVSSKGWSYVGCANDSHDSRVLPSERTGSKDMTIEKCIDHCSGKGYKFAGTQWSEECYCGNSLDTTKLTSESVCDMKCAGDSTQYCGAGLKLSVYKKN